MTNYALRQFTSQEVTYNEGDLIPDGTFAPRIVKRLLNTSYIGPDPVEKKLTPAEKAAATRKANKEREEQEAAAKEEAKLKAEEEAKAAAEAKPSGPSVLD